MLGIDFGELIGPDMSVIETVLRGTVVYFVIFVLLRLVLRGRTGGTTMSDLLVLVLVADAAQNAMADEYRSLANGTVLVATIIGWSFTLDWLAYRVPAVERVVHPEKTPLVQNGRLIRSALARELILASLTQSFRFVLGDYSPNADLNEQVAASALSCVDQHPQGAAVPIADSAWLARL